MTRLQVVRNRIVRPTRIISRTLSDSLLVADSLSSVVVPGNSAEWADVYVDDVDDLPAQLATDGRKVGFRLTSLSTAGQQLTSGNGAALSIDTDGSFDGNENALRILPPTATVSGEAQYACIFRFMDLWNGGAKDIAQLNFRWYSYFGPRYFDLSKTKLNGFTCAATLGAAANQRQASWEARDTGWTTYKYLSTTSNSVQNYHNPPVNYGDPTEQGNSIDSGADTAKLCQIFSSANHALNPPRIGDEWVCFEHIIDLRQDRGNANGMNKLMLWTRDGVVNGRNLNTPADWDNGASPWTFLTRYIAQMEYFGGYWNEAGTAHADNYHLASHWTFAVNMEFDETITQPTDAFFD